MVVARTPLAVVGNGCQQHYAALYAALPVAEAALRIGKLNREPSSEREQRGLMQSALARLADSEGVEEVPRVEFFYHVRMTHNV